MSNLPYLIAGLLTLGLGIYVLKEKKVGVSVWKRRGGYNTKWLSENVSQIAGLMLATWGLIFSVDALRVIVMGQVGVFCYLWGCGFALWIIGINEYAHRYVVTPEDRE